MKISVQISTNKIKTDDTLVEMPVVILTTSSDEKDVAMVDEHHANSYIVKPMDYDSLVDLMDNLGYN